MKRSLLIILFGLGLALGGASYSSSGGDRNKDNGGMPFVAGGGGTAAKGGAPATNYPAGAMYTIHCATYTGVRHIEQSKQMKAQLEQTAQIKHMKDWYVIHSEGQSVLNYGFYGDVDNDPKEAARFKADQRSIAGLINMQSGDRIFPLTPRTPIERGGGGGEGQAEWELTRSKGVWSLEVAAYKQGDRKKNAVDCVRRAREMGYEAYYYHGPMISSVCIGSWPEKSVKVEQPKQTTEDPDSPVIVLGPGMERMSSHFRQELTKRPILTPDGARAVILQPKIEILDPAVRKAMAENPHHAVDGDLLKRPQRTADGRTTYITDASFLVRIPRQNDPNFAPVAPGTYGGAGGSGGATMDDGYRGFRSREGN